MVITISLSGAQLAHMQPQQMGAFVAHCFGLKKFHSIRCFKTYVEVCFVMENFAMMVDATKLQQQLETEIAAFADREPFPCPLRLWGIYQCLALPEAV